MVDKATLKHMIQQVVTYATFLNTIFRRPELAAGIAALEALAANDAELDLIASGFTTAAQMWAWLIGWLKPHHPALASALDVPDLSGVE